MADRFPGGVISKTPPVIVAPVDGEGGSASGVWTLDEQLGLQKAGAWPQGVLPRELYAWGRNNTGELGDGTVVARSSPVQIGALSDWSETAHGQNHTIAVKTNGTLWSWGFNGAGQRGDGTVIPRSSPVQIGALTGWYQVAAAASHSAAIKTDGTLWTWGAGSNGALGLNDIFSRSSPVQIGALSNWAQIAAGGAFHIAVKTDGTLWSWGGNARGQLGLGNSGYTNRSSPVQVGVLTNWARASAGSNASSFAVTTGGELYAWGYNQGGATGQLGDGTVFSRSLPVQIGALTNWLRVGCGTGHAAAIKTDGTLWTWGRGFNGQIGDGTTVDRSSPVQIGALTNWAQVSGGARFIVSAKTDGTLWAWGQNSNGTIGDGTTVDRSSPVQIGALTNWSKVSARDVQAAAITRG